MKLITSYTRKIILSCKLFRCVWFIMNIRIASSDSCENWWFWFKERVDSCRFQKTTFFVKIFQLFLEIKLLLCNVPFSPFIKKPNQLPLESSYSRLWLTFSDLMKLANVYIKYRSIVPFLSSLLKPLHRHLNPKFPQLLLLLIGFLQVAFDFCLPKL